MNVLGDMLSRLQASRRARIDDLGTSPSLVERIDRLVDGDWSLDDVIEAQIDELSNSTSVGSGIAKPLNADDDEDRLLRLVRAYEHSDLAPAEFLQQWVPGAPRELKARFRSLVKARLPNAS